MIQTNGMVLGVDLGVNSVGLALIDPSAQRIVHTAVRVFPAGVEGDFEKGKDSSRNQARREARLTRRQTERRARRARKVYRFLQHHGFLPDGDAAPTLKELDRQLSLTYGPHPGAPYTLRARALDHPLLPFELGRALYHLSQRRGFRSNRRAPLKESEKPGEVDTQLDGLRAEIRASGARTLGEYLAGLRTGRDPQAPRIRDRYTHRAMFQDEFNAIVAAQSQHHPLLADSVFRDSLWDLLFFQRPLKDQSHLIGPCSLLPDQRRAPLYHLDVQRWRLLDKVNNLRLMDSNRTLTDVERTELINQLTHSESLTYPKVRSLLGLPKTARFSIETGPEKSILGNVTYARFAAALNLRWDQMDRAAQDRLVELWASAPDDESFRDSLESTNEYSADEVERLLKVRLPEDYVGFCLTAIQRLLPHMENGITTAGARKIEFPESFKATEPRGTLPPVLDALPELRNPAVSRTLTELRKAVNELIRRFGKPAEIRIELARDLKRNKKDRAKLTKAIEENTDRREEAKRELLKYDNRKWSRTDETKYLLWNECGKTCPYSGRPICMKALFDEAQFEIEHIIPYSRCLDDSYSNLTLCSREYNARKGKSTPWEAFGNSEEWDAMVARVRLFNNKAKLRRFTLDETETQKLLTTFTSNQLSDTRYMSKLAGRYLGVLYGGFSDASGTNRIKTCAGQVTAILRRLWDLNRILSETPEKSRNDHRHHAVDAAAVAMVSQDMIESLARASAVAESAGQRRLKSFPEPWTAFRDEVRERILNHTIVSHRPERKLSGALHQATLYGRPHEENGKPVVHLRTAVEDLSAKDIENIVDRTVRDRVRAQWHLVGQDAKKLKGNPPTLLSGVPIRKVRVKQVSSTVVIGHGPRRRHVIPGDNHHMAVFAIQKRGSTVYEGRVTTLLEANRRHRWNQPVVPTEGGPNEQFLFSLSKGDMVRWKGELWRVNGVSVEMNGRLSLSRATDARLVKDMKGAGDLFRPTANLFCESGGRKVSVSPLGAVREAND